MSPKRYKIIIEHQTDSYEFLVQDNLILRITKFVGDSGLDREVKFDHVPEQVKRDFDHQFNQQ